MPKRPSSSKSTTAKFSKSAKPAKTTKATKPSKAAAKPLRGGVMDRFQAAEYLAISVRKLDSMLQKQELTRIKNGRKTVIRISELDELIDNLEKRSSCPV